jgi:uncharacterized protein (DUF305 family)
MINSSRSTLLAGALATVGLMACSSATQQAGGSASAMTPAQQVAAEKGIEPYTAADVRFMTGMIGHHAQAVLIAGWAQSHGASPSVVGLCERIVVGQRDEIALMSRWLSDRKLPVPSADASHMMMPGMQMDHSAMMPGMLTAEQLTELDKARGPEWDRLFLKDMIQHHRGAISMVEQLFASYGAAQDDQIYKFATDVNVDQTTEIDRMTLMLSAMDAGGAGGARNPR